MQRKHSGKGGVFLTLWVAAGLFKTRKATLDAPPGRRQPQDN